jgi:hypothetical protein
MPSACHVHAIEPHLWGMMFALLAELFKKRCSLQQTYYAVDALSVVVCDNIRIRRCCRLCPLQRVAVKLNHNTTGTPALAQEVFSEEQHALVVRVV